MPLALMLHSGPFFLISREWFHVFSSLLKPPAPSSLTLSRWLYFPFPWENSSYQERTSQKCPLPHFLSTDIAASPVSMGDHAHPLLRPASSLAHQVASSLACWSIWQCSSPAFFLLCQLFLLDWIFPVNTHKHTLVNTSYLDNPLLIPFQPLATTPFLFSCVAKCFELFSIFPTAYSSSHIPLGTHRHQAFAPSSLPNLLSSGSQLVFLLLNPVVSFHPSLYLIPHLTSSLLNALVIFSWLPGYHTLLVFPPSLTVISSQSPFLILPGHLLSCWSAWRSLETFSSYFHQQSLPQWSYRVWSFKSIQKPTSHASSVEASLPHGKLSRLPLERHALSYLPSQVLTTAHWLRHTCWPGVDISVLSTRMWVPQRRTLFTVVSIALRRVPGA